MKWNIELFVADREYICEVKVLLLPTIFITFFPVRLYGVFFSLRKFSPKFHIWIVYGPKGCEKCFFDLVFGLTVIRDLVLKILHLIFDLDCKARVNIHMGMNNNGFYFSYNRKLSYLSTQKVTDCLTLFIC